MSGGPVPVLVVEILNVLAVKLDQNFTGFANPQSAKVAMTCALSKICGINKIKHYSVDAKNYKKSIYRICKPAEGKSSDSFCPFRDLT